MKKYLYIMQSDDGMVKIGVANNVELRRAQIQCGSGHALKIISAHGPFFRSFDIEKNIHRRLAESKKIGEWFDCGLTLAVGAVNHEVAEFQDSEIPLMHTPEEQKIMQDALFKDLKIGHHATDFKKYISQEYLNLGESYCEMEKEFGEAVELLSWYRDSLVKALAVGRAGIARVEVLEAELASLMEQAQRPLHLV